MKVWQCLSPNVGPFHIYAEKPGLNACDPTYHAHQKCGEMELVSIDALVIEKVGGDWPILLELEMAGRNHQTRSWAALELDALAASQVKDNDPRS